MATLRDANVEQPWMARVARRGRGGRDADPACRPAPGSDGDHPPAPVPRARRTIRSATLVGYEQAAASVGLDPAAMLARVGLGAVRREEGDARIALDAYLALLALSAKEARCGDFGIRAAMARGIPDYGLVSLLMREAETVEDVLSLYARHLTSHCDDVLIELDRRFDNPFILTSMPGNTPDEIAQATQFCMVGVTGQLRWLTGCGFEPKLICFHFPRPSTAFPASRFVDCEIAYDQTVSGIVVKREILSRPVVTSTPSLRRIAARQFVDLLAAPPGRFSAKVRQAVRSLLPDGRCSSRMVAARFRIDRRTLARRLECEGLTFSSVVQDVRAEVAVRVLEDSRHSLTDVADLIGFESLSSFSRWFQRTFGVTASVWRRGV